MDLQEFNIRTLNAIGIVDAGGGHLSRQHNDQPFMIGKKRVVLPTTEHLRSDSDNVIIYHPLSENITRSESDMIKAMRDTIMFKLAVTSAGLLKELGRVAATESEHKRLDASSSAYLKAMRDMDEKSYDYLEKILMKVGHEPEKRLISISLRKGDKSDGVLRSCRFKFPIFEALLEDDKELLGSKYPSKKVRANMIALFELVFGDEETRAGFDFGSKNMTAPYFHSLMMGFGKVATHLNAIVKKHKKLLGNELVEELTIDTSWEEGMDDLPALRKKVPPQEGNEGAIVVSTKKEQAKVSENLSDRMAPPTRQSREVPPASRVDRDEPRRSSRRDEPVDVPWDDEPVTTVTKNRVGKSLDEWQNDQRNDSRRDDYGRRDRYDRFDRRDDRGGRSYDLGLDDGRDDRYSDRNYRRDDRGRSGRGNRDRSGRGSFGAGHSRSGF